VTQVGQTRFNANARASEDDALTSIHRVDEDEQWLCASSGAVGPKHGKAEMAQ
jgi:hypothetical protein